MFKPILSLIILASTLTACSHVAKPTSYIDQQKLIGQWQCHTTSPQYSQFEFHSQSEITANGILQDEGQAIVELDGVVLRYQVHTINTWKILNNQLITQEKEILIAKEIPPENNMQRKMIESLEQNNPLFKENRATLLAEFSKVDDEEFVSEIVKLNDHELELLHYDAEDDYTINTRCIR